MRANFDLAQKGLIEAGLYNKAELGIIGTGAGLAYGLSKFVMAWMSDRSNPKVFYRSVYYYQVLYDNDGLMPWATSGIAVMFIMIS
ncbi:glycerol-3-phosphate transporter [Actinobacillus equuli]|nr:glycerol-3-phosphate transporter [Actinobacillus equuli]